MANLGDFRPVDTIMPSMTPEEELAALDPIQAMVNEKVNRVDEKVSRLAPLANFTSPDADNINDTTKAYNDPTRSNRLASDGSYDAWETPKPPSWYEDPKYGKQRLQHLAEQRLKLDAMRGLAPGTSTVADVHEMGLNAQDALTTLQDNALIQDPNAQVEFRDINAVDRSGGNRTITHALINGEDVGNKLGAYEEFNANRHSYWNQNAQTQAEAGRAYRQINPVTPENAYSKEEIQSSVLKNAYNVGNKVMQGIYSLGEMGIQAGAGAARRATEYGISDKDRYSMQQIEELKADGQKLPQYLKDFQEGKYYKNPEYEQQKVFDKIDEAKAYKKKGVLGKLMSNIGSTIDNTFGSNQDQETEAQFKARKEDEKKHAFITSSDYAKAKAGSEIAKFQEAVTEHGGESWNKNINDYKSQEKAIEHQFGSGKNLESAVKNFNKGVKNGDVKSIAKSVYDVVKGGSNLIKESADAEYIINGFASSAPEMAAATFSGGLYFTASALNNMDKFDRAYRKEHHGMSASGSQQIAQATLASGIALSQVGAAELALGGTMEKFLAKGGFGLKKVHKKGKMEYDAYIPYSLNKKYKGVSSEITEKEVDDLVKVLDSRIMGMRFAKNDKLNELAFAIGKPVKEVGKALLLASWAATKNAGRVVGAGAGEYSQEFIEEVFGQMGENIGTERSIDYLKAHIAGSAGFAVGGGIRATVNAPRTVTETGKALLGIKDEAKGVTIYGKRKDEIHNEIFGNMKDGQHKAEVIASSPIIDNVINEPAKHADVVATVYDTLENELQDAMNTIRDPNTDTETKSKLINAAVTIREKQDKIIETQQELQQAFDKDYSAKSVQEYDDKDVADELMSDPNKAFNNIEKMETRGEVSAEAKAIIQEFKKLKSNYSEDMLRVSDEVLKNTTINKKNKQSLKAHMEHITTLLKEGEFTKAKGAINKLSIFAAKHRNKQAKFQKAVDNNNGVKHAGKVYNPEGAATTLKAVKPEADLLALNVKLANYALESYKKRAERKHKVDVTVSLLQDAKKNSKKDDISLFSKGVSNETSKKNTDKSGKSTEQRTDVSDGADSTTGDTNTKTKETKEVKIKIPKSDGSNKKKLETVDKVFNGKQPVTHVITVKGDVTSDQITKNNPNLPSLDTVDNNSVVGVVMPRSVTHNKTRKDLVNNIKKANEQLQQVIDKGAKVIHIVKGFPKEAKQSKDRVVYKVPYSHARMLKEAGYTKQGNNTWVKTKENVEPLVNNDTLIDGSRDNVSTDESSVTNDNSKDKSTGKWNFSSKQSKRRQGKETDENISLFDKPSTKKSSEAKINKIDDSILKLRAKLTESTDDKVKEEIKAKIRKLNKLKDKINAKTFKESSNEKSTNASKKDVSKTESSDKSSSTEEKVQNDKTGVSTETKENSSSSSTSSDGRRSVSDSDVDNSFTSLVKKMAAKTRATKNKRENTSEDDKDVSLFATGSSKKTDSKKKSKKVKEKAKAVKLKKSGKKSTKKVENKADPKTVNADAVNTSVDTTPDPERAVLFAEDEVPLVVDSMYDMDVDHSSVDLLSKMKGNLLQLSGLSERRIAKIKKIAKYVVGYNSTRDAGNGLGKKGTALYKKQQQELKSFMSANIKNTDEAFEWAIAASKSLEQKRLLKAMYKYVKEIGYNIPVIVNEAAIHNGELTNLYGESLKDAAGNPTKAAGTVNYLKGMTLHYIKDGDKQVFSYRTVVHELAHVATILQLENKNNKDLNKEISRLRKLAKESGLFSSKDLHGLKSNAEFVAELTNPAFAAKLDQIPNKIEEAKVKIKRNKSGTILQSAINIYKQLARRFSKQNYIDGSVLDSMLDITATHLLNQKVKSNEISSTETFYDQVLNGKNETTRIAKAVLSNIAIRSTKAKSVLKNIPNALTENKEALLKKLNLSDYETDLFNNIVQYTEEFKDLLIDIAGESGRKITTEIAHNDPILALVAETGNIKDLPDNWFSAMGITVMKFVATELNTTKYQNAKQIRNAFGLKEEEPLDWGFVNAMSKKGVSTAVLVQKLGTKVLKEMNIAEKPTAEDAELYDRLATSIGQLMLEAMVHAGYIQISAVRNRAIAEYLPKSKRPDEMDAYTTYARVTTTGSYDEQTGNYVEEIHPGILEEQLEYSTNGYAELIDYLFDSSTKNKVLLADEKPADNQVPSKIKGSFMKASNKMLKGMRNMSKRPWVPNTRRISAWTALSLNTQFEILGAKNPDEHLEHYRDSIEGKNNSIETDITNLNNYINRHEGNLPEYVYFLSNMWKNIRQGLLSNEINIQQSKLHRALFHAKDWETTFNTGNKDDMHLFNKAVKQVIGKDVSELVNADGSFTSKELQNAADIFNESIENTPEMEADFKYVLDKVLGEGMHGFVIMEALADYSEALKNGTPTDFSVTAYVEPDGTTNGTFNATMQTVFDPMNKLFRKTVNASGLYFKDDAWSSLDEYLENNLDNYQNLISEIASKFNLLDREHEVAKVFDKIDSLIMAPLFNKEGITKEGRNFAKPFVMTFVYAKGEKSMSNDALLHFQEGMYSFIEENIDNEKKLTELVELLEEFDDLMGTEVFEDLDFSDAIGDVEEMRHVELPINAIRELFKPEVDITKGALISEALKHNHKDLIKARDDINEGLQNAYIIGKAILDKEIELLEIEKANLERERNAKYTKERMPLNKQEYRDLMDRLIKEGKMPTVKHATSENHNDSVLIQVSTNTAYGDKVISELKKPINTEITEEILGDGTEVKEEHDLEYFSNRPYKMEFDSNIGVKGFVNLTLSLDGNTQNGVLGNPARKTGGNVHDASTQGFRNYIDEAAHFNKFLLGLHGNYDMMESVLNTVQRMDVHKRMYEEKYPGIFDELNGSKKIDTTASPLSRKNANRTKMTGDVSFFGKGLGKTDSKDRS